MKRLMLLLSLVLVVTTTDAAVKHKRTPRNKASIVQAAPMSESDRQRFDYLFQQAINLKHQEKFAEAFELFRQCTLIDSLNPQPWYELSSFYRGMNAAEPALSTLEKAYNLYPSNEWYAFGLANLLMALNRQKDAIVLYERLVENRPDDENLLFQLAGLYAKTGALDAAIKTFNRVERLIGKNETVSFEKFNAYKTQGKPKKAIREIELLRDEYPNDVDYVLLLGDAWMDLEEFPKAYATYMEASAMDPTNPAIPLSLADYYSTTGDSLAAVDELRKALTNPSTDVETKLNILAPVLVESLKKGDSLKVQTYFDQLLEQHPNEYQIREMYVQWLMEMGKKQEARNELKTVLDLNPNQLKAWRMYLEINLENDNQSNIRNICKRALDYFPNEAIFWFYYGLSWSSEQEEGRPDSEKSKFAIDAFKKAIELADQTDIGFVSRLYGLCGDMYLLQKDTTAAFDYYEKAMAVNPNNILVLNNYAYYLAVSGKELAKAERMSRKTIEADPKNVTFLDTYAWVFFKQGEFRLAKIYIERAIENETNPGVEVLEHYGDILWFNQDSTGALVQWKKASKLENPNPTLLMKVQTGRYIEHASNLNE